MRRLLLIVTVVGCGSPSAKVDLPTLAQDDQTVVLGMLEPGGEQAAHLYEIDQDGQIDFAFFVDDGTELQLGILPFSPEELRLDVGKIELRGVTDGEPLPPEGRYFSSRVDGDRIDEWTTSAELTEPLTRVRRGPAPDKCYEFTDEGDVVFVDQSQAPMIAPVDADRLLVLTATAGFFEVVRGETTPRLIEGLPNANNVWADERGHAWAVNDRGGLWRIEHGDTGYNATQLVAERSTAIAVPTHVSGGRRTDNRSEVVVLDHDASVWFYREGDDDWTIDLGVTSTVGAAIWEGDIAWIGDGRAMVTPSTWLPTVVELMPDGLRVRPVSLEGSLAPREWHKTTAASYDPARDTVVVGSWHESWVTAFELTIGGILERRQTWFLDTRLIELVTLDSPDDYLYAGLDRTVGIVSVGSPCIGFMRIGEGEPRSLVKLGRGKGAAATGVDIDGNPSMVHFFSWRER